MIRPFRVLAPFALAVVAVPSFANRGPAPGGFGVWTRTLEGTTIQDRTLQNDGGTFAYEALCYGSTEYSDSDYGIHAGGDAHAHGSLLTGTVGAWTSGSSEVDHPQNRELSTQTDVQHWDLVTITGPMPRRSRFRSGWP